jgi:hypothetical protein
MGISCYYWQRSHTIGLFTNSFSETKSQSSSRKLYQQKVKQVMGCRKQIDHKPHKNSERIQI